MTAVADTLVLLVNTGSPAEPTPAALKTYLAEFLGDRRVVEMPKIPEFVSLEPLKSF